MERMAGNRKLLIICGPTATGKTGLAIKLAKSAIGGKGEIVSADSRQVYKGMDIGTGKDLPKNSKFKISPFAPPVAGLRRDKQIGYYEIEGVRVWLYDVVEPDYRFSVADYVECANLVIKDIWKRKKMPILVGGTGFYIKAVVDGIGTLGVGPDWKLRKRLRYKDIKILREMLGKLNPERLRRMNESDRNNPRRLIRAIEIAFQNKNEKIKMKKYNEEIKMEDLLFIGLKAPFKELYGRIDKRVEERVNLGVEEEIRNLLKKGHTFQNSVLGATIGYKEWQEKIPKNEIIKSWKYDEHGYARRQMTWFKKALRLTSFAQGKNRIVGWFDITRRGWQLNVVDFVKNWYYRN